MVFGCMCFVIDVNVEFGVWCDLCEKPSSGCRIHPTIHHSNVGIHLRSATIRHKYILSMGMHAQKFQSSPKNTQNVTDLH
jgi:hypothetical protein